MCKEVVLPELTFDTLANYRGEYAALAIQLSKLLAQLSKNAVPVTVADLSVLCANRATETVELLFVDEVLVGTAQASLIRTFGAPIILVNNVIIDSEYRRRGFGLLLMRQLLARVSLKWQQALPVRVQLTSNENRHTAEFYTALGFSVRDTIVYQQEVR